MPIEYEYEVVVAADIIKGTLKTADGVSYFEEHVSDDDERRLRLDTIDVLRSWLNRWTALTRMSEYEHLTVLNTFTVLGRHLYATVFSGDVGNGLQRGRERATRARTTLRLLLSFHPSAEALSQLPWELLHAGGYFLASEHRLVLSRRLPLTRRSMVPPEPPLMVDFLVTVPDTPEYEAQRKELLAALERPMEYTTSLDHQVLEHWDEDEAVKLLSTAPYPQIVHIIGVCRRYRDQDLDVMQVYLDDGDGARWRNALVLVNLFNGNDQLSEKEQVRLVVLHLCEPSPLDFEVTFERLAPALIERGIPAVLAMQYPLSGKAAGRFVKKLYESLADARSLEEAVQRARSDLLLQFEQDRLFGSPVLYMQTVDSQLLSLPTGSPAGADAGPSSVSAAKPPPRSTLDWLLEQLATLDEPAEERQRAEWIMREIGDWPPRLSDAERLLARQVRDYVYESDLARVFSRLVKAVQDRMGGRDD